MRLRRALVELYQAMQGKDPSKGINNENQKQKSDVYKYFRLLKLLFLPLQTFLNTAGRCLRAGPSPG